MNLFHCAYKFLLLVMLNLNVQKLLEVLHSALPKMSLIASDFSYLPDVRIPGERAPLVSTKVWCFSHHLSGNFSGRVLITLQFLSNSKGS